MAEFSPVIPFLRYRNPTAAVDWLVDNFGFTRHDVTVVEGEVVHAELSFGAGTVQLGGGGPDDALGMSSPLDLPGTSQGVYVCVGDDAAVDEHYAKATAAGTKVLYELHDTHYGSRDYGISDLEGHVWSFGSYRPK